MSISHRYILDVLPLFNCRHPTEESHLNESIYDVFKKIINDVIYSSSKNPREKLCFISKTQFEKYAKFLSKIRIEPGAHSPQLISVLKRNCSSGCDSTNLSTKGFHAEEYHELRSCIKKLSRDKQHLIILICLDKTYSENDLCEDIRREAYYDTLTESNNTGNRATAHIICIDSLETKLCNENRIICSKYLS